MIPLPWRIGGAALLVVALIAGTGWYRHALILDGVTQESDRRNKLATDALLAANTKVKLAQTKVTELQGELSKLQSENTHAQTESYLAESAFRGGTDRLFATFVKQGIDTARQAGDTAAPTVDSGTRVSQDLAPEVAGNLESFRRNENNAIDRLNACVEAYGKVKAASDAQ